MDKQDRLNVFLPRSPAQARIRLNGMDLASEMGVQRLTIEATATEPPKVHMVCAMGELEVTVEDMEITRLALPDIRKRMVRNRLEKVADWLLHFVSRGNVRKCRCLSCCAQRILEKRDRVFTGRNAQQSPEYTIADTAMETVKKVLVNPYPYTAPGHVPYTPVLLCNLYWLGDKWGVKDVVSGTLHTLGLVDEMELMDNIAPHVEALPKPKIKNMGIDYTIVDSNVETVKNVMVKGLKPDGPVRICDLYSTEADWWDIRDPDWAVMTQLCIGDLEALKAILHSKIKALPNPPSRELLH